MRIFPSFIESYSIYYDRNKDERRCQTNLKKTDFNPKTITEICHFAVLLQNLAVVKNFSVYIVP